MKKPRQTDFDTIVHFEAAMVRYNAYKAEKAKANQEYRARRTQREKEAQAAAAALRANRDIDPTREEWLMRAAGMILKQVAELGYIPTGDVKVSLGALTLAGRKKKPAYGVCYHGEASEGGYREIFIDASLTDTRFILGTLTHEIGHAVLKDGTGHRKPFKTFCEKVGFDFRESGKAEHAGDGDEWWNWASLIARDLGNIPHKRLNTMKAEGEKKKQKARLLLCECPECELKVRTAKKTLEQIEDNGHTYLRCVDPSCFGKIDINAILEGIDGGGEEE